MAGRPAKPRLNSCSSSRRWQCWTILFSVDFLVIPIDRHIRHVSPGILSVCPFVVGFPQVKESRAVRGCRIGLLKYGALQPDLPVVLSNTDCSADNSPPGDWKNVLRGHDASPEASLRRLASLPSDGALSQLNSDINGLTEREAASRLAVTGPNLLPSKKPMTWWRLLLLVLPNPFNILLALLAIISAATPPPQWVSWPIFLVCL